MSTQRYISTSFWDDPWIKRLKPDERYLYLYLLTNPLTNIAGVYQISMDRICFDSGYKPDKTKSILEIFEKSGKAFFYKEELIIIPGWPKHQKWEKASKIKQGIETVLKKLPTEVLNFLKKIGYRYPIDTLSIPYLYPSNYSDIDIDIDIDSDNKEVAPPVVSEKPFASKSEKAKKLPLREREPVNDIERVEKAYLENWDSLYSQGKVKAVNPVVNWNKTRKLLKALFESLDTEIIIQAVNNGMNDDWIMNSGYSLEIMLSASVLNRLINAGQRSPPSSKHQQNKKSLE